MKRLYLAVKIAGKSNYAQHGMAKEMGEEEFLALPEVQRVLKNAARFGDKVRLMEENPDPLAANWLVRELI